MPVTELAKLRIHHGQQQVSQTLRGKLLHAKEAMEKSSGYAFSYYLSIDDLGVMFIVGAWPSVDFDLHEFIPSAPNQELLESLKNDISVEWMFHVDVDPSRMPPPQKIDTIVIKRQCVQASIEQCVNETLAANRHELESHNGSRSFIEGGWRVDDNQPTMFSTHPSAEAVLFTGKKDVEVQPEQNETKKSAEHSRDHKSGDVEIFHVNLISVDQDI